MSHYMLSPRSLSRLRGLLPLLAVALVLGSRPVAAQPTDSQPAGLVMQVTAGYEGAYKVGEWFPVRVALRNDGATPLAGRVEVRASNEGGNAITTYARDVDLPAPSRKEVTLYTYAASYARSLDVTLAQGSTVLATQKIQLSPVEYPAYLVGVVSDDAGLLNFLKDVEIAGVSQRGGAGVKIVHLQPADLPANTAALAGLDALVLAGTNTTNLPTEVHDALAGWVLRGGLLVVGGGPNVQATAAGVADLLPLRVTGARPTSDFAALAGYVGLTPSTLNDAPALAAGGPLIDDPGSRILAGSADLPLLAQRIYGAGRVTFLALDPGQPPLRDWNGGVQFWSKLLQDNQVELSLAARRRLDSGYSYSYSYSGSTYGTHPFDIAGLELPSGWLVGGFLLIYLLLLGPINYLVLRLLKRVELAWVTIPALILVFVIASYVLGVASKGSALRLAQASVVHTYPGAALATVDNFVGLLSPTRSTYALSFPGDTPLTELDASARGYSGNSATVVLGRPTQVQNLTIDTWALRGFLAEAVLPYTPPLTATVRLENGHLRGQVTNQGPTALHDVGVIHTNAAQHLGDLAPGQSVEINLAYPSGSTIDSAIETLLPGAKVNSYSYGYSSSFSTGTPAAQVRALNRRESVLGLALTDSPRVDSNLTLVGWGGPPPLAPQIPGANPQHEDLTLVLADVPLPAGALVTTPPVDVAAALPGWKLQYGAVSAGPADAPVVLNLGAGAVTFMYTLPQGATAPDTLDLDYDLRGAGDDATRDFSLRVELYNWMSNTFELPDQNSAIGDIAGSQGRVTGSLHIADAASYIGPSRQIDLRFTQVSGAGQIAVQRLQFRGLDLPTPAPTTGTAPLPSPTPSPSSHAEAARGN